jgi:hypothetical protein
MIPSSWSGSTGSILMLWYACQTIALAADGPTNVQTNSPHATPSGVVSETALSKEHPRTSLNWLIGRWEWVKKERCGALQPGLEALSALRVFPYAEYGIERGAGQPVPIAAELLTTDLYGKEEVLVDSLPVYVVDDSIRCGRVTEAGAWDFRYAYVTNRTGEYLDLELRRARREPTTTLTVTFVKVNLNPGQPVDFKRATEHLRLQDWEMEENESRWRARLAVQGDKGPLAH